MTDPSADTGHVLSGRYHLGEELGRGGAGRVFRGRDDRLDRDVAVKVLTDVGESAVTRFRREAATAARIRHPNVVTLHDAGVDGAPYIVMTLVEGPSLAERVGEHGPLSHEDQHRLATDLFAGLDATHRAGVMHRDLTPRNVLFDRDGTALLADFGIARGPDDPTVTAEHTVMGTRPYVAPERLRGDDATPASDVYAVGMTLRFAATGTHTDALPDGHPFAQLVAACTSEDPSARPGTAAEAATRLPSADAPTAHAATARTEPLPTSTVTPPVERAPGSDRTHGPRDVDRPVPAEDPAPASSRVRPLAVIGVLAALAVAGIVGSSAVQDTPTQPGDQGTGQTQTASPTAPTDGQDTPAEGQDTPAEGQDTAPSFDAEAPADSARQLADWLRQQGE